jgi:hypothetical protein
VHITVLDEDMTNQLNLAVNNLWTVVDVVDYIHTTIGPIGGMSAN